MRFVDAHLHLWDVDTVPLSWFRDDLGLPRKADLDDLATAFGAGPHPEAVVVVQAADTLAELRWLLERADGAAVRAAVVAQYEPAPGSWAGTAQAVLDGDPAASMVRGVRLAVPTRAADLSDVVGLDDLAAGLAGTGRVLEVLVRPAQLAAVAGLARRHPGLAVVVCHLGLGTSDPDEQWRSGLRLLAQQPGVVAKASGLHRPGEDRARLTEVLSTAVEILGGDRLMFGSDWPVSTRSCGYGETIARTAAALRALPATHAEAFWSGLATRLYLS